MFRTSTLALLSLTIVGCRAHRPIAPMSEVAATKAPSCEELLATPEAVTLLEDLRLAAAAPEVWPDYHLAGRDLVLQWIGEEHHCIAHWSRGELVEVTRAESPIQTPLGIFGFLMTDLAQGSNAERFHFLAGGAPDPIVRSLNERGARAALVWVVNAEKITPEFAGDAATKRTLTQYFLHHESAHVHLLFAPLFGHDDRHPRPSWAVQANEAEILSRCYEAEAARDTFARERAAIADAVEAIAANDGASVRRHALDFITARRQRYEVLQAVRVPSQKGNEQSCPQAEAVWEIDEGGAEYLALTALSAAAIPLPGNQSAAERIRDNTSNEPYYYTGAGQLLVLRYLSPSQALEAIGTVMSSTSFEGGIYGALVRHLVSENRGD